MFTAHDGRKFPTYIQMYRYEKAKEDTWKAPGGPAHQEALRQHGAAKRVTIEATGSGSHRVTVLHADGKTSTEVSPEAHLAFQLGSRYYGVPEPPDALTTHQRARSHPVGPKERDRLDTEDKRAPVTGSGDDSSA